MIDLSFNFEQETVGGGALAQASAPALGISGGDVRGGAADYANTDAIGDPNLPAFLEGMFAPKLQAAKQQKFVQGFVAARSGKTQQEIHDSQPWYAGIFGPTDFELGAQTFGAQQAAANMEQELLENMHELRTFPPEELSARLNEMLTNSLTGNVYTDALITQETISRAGAVVSAHTKARYQWQEEVKKEKQLDSWLASSGAFQAGVLFDAKQGNQFPDQRPTDEQMRERELALLQNFELPEGENPEAWRDNLKLSIYGMADRGDWATISALEKHGFMEQLSLEEQINVRNHLAAARSKFKTQLAADKEFYVPLMQIQALNATGQASANQLDEMFRGLDELYKTRTGDSKGYFDFGDYVSGGTKALTSTFRAMQAVQERDAAARAAADTDALKAQAEAEEAATIASYVMSGMAGEYLSTPGSDRKLIEQAVASHLRVPEGQPWIPQNLAQALVPGLAAPVAGRRPYVDKPTQQILQGMTNASAGEEWTPAFEAAYTNWRNLYTHTIALPDGGTDVVSGKGAAATYFGADLHGKMMRYHAMRISDTERTYAYKATFGKDAFGDSGGSKEDIEELAAVVKDTTQSWWPGHQNLGESGQALMTSLMMPHYRAIRADPSVTPEVAARSAFQAIQAEGFEVSGRYAWAGGGREPISRMLGMEPAVFEEHFAPVIDRKLEAAGMRVSNKTSVSINRLGDLIMRDEEGNEISRTPQLMVRAWNKDGIGTTLHIDSSMIEEVRNEAAFRETTGVDAARKDVLDDPTNWRPGGMGSLR